MRYPEIQVKVRAEFCYALVTLAALVETAVCTLCFIVTTPLSLVNKRPFKVNIKRFESSAFSIIWGAAYALNNFKFPHLPTNEVSLRNYIFRGDIKNTESWPQAPFSRRAFMFLKEFPKYLSAAYDYHFKQTIQVNLYQRIRNYKFIVNKILTGKFSTKKLGTNVVKLSTIFCDIIDRTEYGSKPICAYFVGTNDKNGALLSKRVIYYHLYKIKKFEEYFDVVPAVVNTMDDIFMVLANIKQNLPDNPIKLVDIVAHGSSASLVVSPFKAEKYFTAKHVAPHQFNACAEDANIILDACSTGAGGESIASLIAENNPGKKVYAPGSALAFSNPRFSKNNNNITIEHITYGLSLIANTFRLFEHKTSMD